MLSERYTTRSVLLLKDILEIFPSWDLSVTGLLLVSLLILSEIFSMDISEIAVLIVFLVSLIFSGRFMSNNSSTAEEIRKTEKTDISVIMPISSITLFLRLPDETKIFFFSDKNRFSGS